VRVPSGGAVDTSQRLRRFPSERCFWVSTDADAVTLRRFPSERCFWVSTDADAVTPRLDFGGSRDTRERPRWSRAVDGADEPSDAKHQELQQASDRADRDAQSANGRNRLLVSIFRRKLKEAREIAAGPHEGGDAVLKRSGEV
jgi:hypothetical protein